MERDAYTKLAELEATHWWFTGRRAIVDAALGRLGMVEGARLLEVGCGSGGMLPVLARHGHVCGLELDEAMRARAAARGYEVREGWLPDGLPPAYSNFHLIGLFDVLEHVEDHTAALRALRQRVVPGGQIMLTVPAYAFLWSGHDVVNHHYRRYTRTGLVGALAASGWQVEWVSYFNTVLFPAIAGVRLGKRLLKRAEGDLEGLPGARVNSVLAWLFGLEARLIGRLRLPFGVSVMAVGRRVD